MGNCLGVDDVKQKPTKDTNINTDNLNLIYPQPLKYVKKDDKPWYYYYDKQMTVEQANRLFGPQQRN